MSKTYKEQQEEKGLVFVPFQTPMYIYLRTQALNPNQKIDYYEVAGIWKAPKEIQKEIQKNKSQLMMFTMCLIIGLLVNVLIIIYV